MRAALVLLAASAPAFLTAGCGASSPGVPAGASAASALPMAHGRSWMLPQARRATLIYAVDSQTGDVNVYDYANGKQVGTIAEFMDAGCVDAKGNVYLVKFSGESVLEYAHGGTQPIQTYTPGGELAGCSVDAKGDVEITGSQPGNVTIYPKGDPTRGVSYSNSECETQGSLGYDNKGNVLGTGEYNIIVLCGVLHGTKQETTLTASGFTIYHLNGTMWDGKYIAVSDELAHNSNATSIYETSLSGTTLTSNGEVKLEDTCYRGYSAVGNPFILGTKNTPDNEQQGKVVVGVNFFCFMSQDGGIEFWHYPKGGNPFKIYKTTDEISVLAVSI